MDLFSIDVLGAAFLNGSEHCPWNTQGSKDEENKCQAPWINFTISDTGLFLCAEVLKPAPDNIADGHKGCEKLQAESEFVN